MRCNGRVFPFSNTTQFDDTFRAQFEHRRADPNTEQPMPITTDNSGWPSPIRVELSDISDMNQWTTNPRNIWIGRNRGPLRDRGYGNPYKISRGLNRTECIRLFGEFRIPQIAENSRLMFTLRNASQIGCACKRNEQCHGDLLLSLCN